MLKNIYNLKQKEFDILFNKKTRLLNQLRKIDDEIDEIDYELTHVSVDRFGAISDFVMLSIHKNYLKELKISLNHKKDNIKKQINSINKKLVIKNKEIEQFSYLIEEEIKDKINLINKQERLIVEDLVQAKFFKDKKGDF